MLNFFIGTKLCFFFEDTEPNYVTFFFMSVKNEIRCIFIEPETYFSLTPL